REAERRGPIGSRVGGLTGPAGQTDWNTPDLPHDSRWETAAFSSPRLVPSRLLQGAEWHRRVRSLQLVGRPCRPGESALDGAATFRDLTGSEVWIVPGVRHDGP